MYYTSIFTLCCYFLLFIIFIIHSFLHINRELSSGNSSVTLSKVSQLVSFSFYLISLCITPSCSFFAIIYFSSSSSLFTPSSISTGEVSSEHYFITFSKVSQLVYLSFSVTALCITFCVSLDFFLVIIMTIWVFFLNCSNIVILLTRYFISFFLPYANSFILSFLQQFPH